jgi:hypothetical protein
LSCDAIAIARPRFNVDDMRDLGAVLDHEGPLPHPADEAQ